LTKKRNPARQLPNRLKKGASRVASVERREPSDEALRSAHAAIEYCYEQGWSDGLPVVPPLQDLVDEFLGQTARDPDEVLMTVRHLDRSCSVRQAAINAVMAGCKAEYFPVVVAAMDAFASGAGLVTGLLQSTTGQAEIVVVNGPIRQRLNFNCQDNIFSPGDRPNATIGRALRLIIMNALGIRPHVFDQSTQGTSAKFSCCIAENEEDSPWEPLHVERGFARSTSTVTVQMVRSDLYVEHRSTQVPEEILLTIADSMSYAGMITQITEERILHGAVVVMGPEHAQIIAKQGWSKQDVKRFLWENFGKTKAELRRFGKVANELQRYSNDEFIRTAASPDSILLVVSGANNAGVSTVCPSFTVGRPGIGIGTREIMLKSM
jgi:hypothetical protein